MKSSKSVNIGILICSISVLVIWALYLYYSVLPGIERLSDPVQRKEELWSLIWHMPGVIPAFLGFFIYGKKSLTKRILLLYLIYTGTFILSYGLTPFFTDPLSGVIPLLLLWVMSIYLLFCILDLFLKRPFSSNKS